jgi:putative transcriptional regulator
MTGRRPAAKLHNRLAVLRAERHLSRQDLAEALGINYQTVGYIERGEFNPSLELALDIATYFDLPVEAVFSREPFALMSTSLYSRRAGDPSQETRNA